ncbi:hypothetical protein Tco_1236376 [Tanacetum coccineum]
MVEEPLKMKKKDQDKVETDYELAQRLQAEEQEELIVEEKSKLFQQLLETRRKHFAAKRAEERRNRPPIKAQQRSLMVNTFVDMDTELVEGSEINDDQEEAEMKKLIEVIPDEEKVSVDVISLATNPPSIVDRKMVKEGKLSFFQIIRANGSAKRGGLKTIAQESNLKRAGDELEQKKAQKQKIDDDQEEAEMKKLMEIIPDKEEVVGDAIPLATKPRSIVDWKIMLRDFDREDLEILWKLEKAKNKICLHIFMLVEKKYPLTPATITDMLNRVLQADYCNEISKRAGDELEQEKAQKQKIDDDQEEAEMKKLIEIVPDEEEVAVDAIPLATKPPSIID